MNSFTFLQSLNIIKISYKYTLLIHPFFDLFIQDDEDFGNGKARIGGPLMGTSDSEDNLEEDEPMTMGNIMNMTAKNTNNNNNLKIYYNNHQNQNSSKKSFKMEVVDF